MNDEIGISPSDVASELVEVNNKITNVNALDNIDDKNNKEVNVNMDEKILELQAEIIDLQSKLENKTDEFEKVNAELNSLKQADELNVCKAELDDVKAELNSCKEELETIKTEKAELNEAIVVAQKEVTAKDTVIAELNSELLPLKEAKELAEKEELKAEVNNAYKKIEDENGFTEEELAELNSFVENVDMDGLKATESEICAKKFKEERIAKKLETEVNSNIIKDEENSSLGLFFSTKVEKDSTELNNVGDDKDGSKLFFEQ